jgi:hypothetical protein
MAEEFDALKMIQQANKRCAAFNQWYESKGLDVGINDAVVDGIHALVARVTDRIRMERDDHEYQPSRLELAEEAVRCLFDHDTLFPNGVKYSVIIDSYRDYDDSATVIPGCSFGSDGER